MAYEKKHGDCVLFENTRRTAENSPIFRGTILLDGTEYELTFWKKTSKAGNEFFSGSVGKPAEPKKPSSGGWGGGFKPKQEAPSKHVSMKDMDDSVPW